MNILTIDVEDWYHLLDNDYTKSFNEWKNFETRIQYGLDIIFSILDKYNQKATFFFLTWLAEKHKDLVHQILERGYEIGSQSHYHQLVYEQNPREFKEDLIRSIKTLEDVSGQRVKYYRAPGFSLTENNKWAFEILTQEGIEVDCSIFPAPRGHGGFPSYTSPVPSLIKYNGIEIKELPINYTKLFGKPLIFSGGGYFRLFPYYLIKHWTKRSNYVMSYLHPRDVDPGQPMIKELPITRKFKSYVGLKNAEKKLEKWLTDFEFVDIGTAVKQIDWEKVPVVDLG